jgi:hypothetical protein
VKLEAQLLWEKKKDQKNVHEFRSENGSAIVMIEEEGSKERWWIEKWKV